MKIIMIFLGELFKPSDFHGFKELAMLKEKGKIEIVELPEGNGLHDFKNRHHQNIYFICHRPSAGVRITDEFLRPLGDGPHYIVTFSVGTDHIKLKDRRHIIISADGAQNAYSAAEFAVKLANEILRPSFESRVALTNGILRQSEPKNALLIKNLKWACIGDGYQVKELLPLLIAHECPKVTVFHPVMDKDRFRKVLIKFSPRTFVIQEVIADMQEQLKATVALKAEQEMMVAGTNDFQKAIAEADVVSLHYPVTTEKNDKYGFPTFQLFNRDTLGMMKDGSYLVNISRGDIVVEKDVLDALETGKLKGYATDVFNSEAEEYKSSEFSKIWSHITEENKYNIAAYPHMAGSSFEALNNVISQVVEQIIIILNEVFLAELVDH